MTSNDVAVLISGGSLLVSVLAWWRSGRARVLEIRTSVRKDVTELRLELDALSTQIAAALQSRERASAATGRGGALEVFRKNAEIDRAAIEPMRTQLNEIERIRPLALYDEVEAKALTAQAVRTRVRQLVGKYDSAAREDERTREYLRNAMTARAQRNNL
jgi:hypothetical protein